MIAAFVTLALASAAPSNAGSPSFAWGGAVPDTALVTYEAGVPVGADWVQRRGRVLRSFQVLMQSGYRELRAVLRDDGTVESTSTRVWDAGGEPGAPMVRALGDGVIYWSDQVASSLDQAVRRASAVGGPLVHVVGASLYRDARFDVTVERLGAADWVLTAGARRYLVLTDSTTGDLLAATMPDYGVVIERRTGVTPAGFAPPWLPYEAAPGAHYRALEVRIPAPEGHLLVGTLTLPQGADAHAPFAAAVLVTGLSPSERNGGSPPWMPLRDLSDALTRRGIAVLRVDDRGEGKSTGDHAPSTTFDEANDVRTEVAWLRERRDVDARRVALVGYSEGGLIAPMVAASDPRLSGVVTLAGPGVPGWDLARYQIEAAVVRDSTIAPADWASAVAKALADSLTPREASYLSIDPLAYARRVRCPVLIVQGGADLHVPLRSAERLAFAMRQCGNADVTVRIFPGVSHSLLPDPVGLNSGWASLPGFLTAPDILRAVGDWLNARLAPRR
jgi:alpha-beta hydrolase superfamily lysophospholipase